MSKDPINFDSSNLRYYLGDSTSEQYVMTKKKNHLKFVPINEISGWEKFKAWFGMGPLSTHSIAKFISKNQEEIDTQINPEDEIAFYKKLTGECSAYNANHHRIHRKIQIPIFEIFQRHLPMTSYASAQKNVTYKVDEESADGNVDFSCVNQLLGYGYVIGGADHNNPQMQQVLKSILEEFNQLYEESLVSREFETVESAQEFIREQFEKLGKALITDERPVKENRTFKDLSLLPAMSFAQVIEVNSLFYVLTLDFADTALLIRTKNGTFDDSLIEERVDMGVGSIKPKVKVTPVLAGDTIVGFSDGIGEFLTAEECFQIIAENDSAKQLLESLKEKIIEKGVEFSHRQNVDENTRREEDIETVNKSRVIKYHTFDEKSPRYHDDISLFILTI